MEFSFLKRLAGTYLAPSPSLAMPSWPAVEQMMSAGLAALAAPPAFLILDRIATVVREQYAQVLWIRLQAADADPGALLATLLGSAARLDAAGSQGIAEVAARHARLGKWRFAYQTLADWLASATASPAVLVLEGAEHLEAGNPAGIDLLVPAFLPHLPGSLDLLLIGFAEWDSRRLSPHGRVLGPSSLRLDGRAAAGLAEACLPDLPPATLDRVFLLTCGAAGALHAAFSAGAALGPEAFCALGTRAGNAQDLLSALGRCLLAHADPHSLISLAEASRLGVWHPAMASVLGHPAVCRSEPWWLDLAEGWRQIVPAWHTLIRSTGYARALDPASLALLADYLASQGIRDRAFELYVEAREVSRAADTALSMARDLASTGCWVTLARLGQVLARDVPAEGMSEPGDAAQHAARRYVWRWRPLFRRTGRERSQPLASSATQVTASTPPVLVTHPSLLEAEQAQSLLPAWEAPAAEHKVAPDVTAHLLGELRVAIRDRPVPAWVSGRGRAVFEYLLVNRHSKVRRDRLMSVFWPEATPSAARNSLNVAIHGLRQSLRPASGTVPVVIHRDRAYFIEPTLEIWVDIEVFEEQLKVAHQHLASAELVKAEAAFEAAACLYQGDFLADDPYETWAIVMREHLRLCYLDALDRLSDLRLNSGDYVGCAAVCLKLIGCDSCREDAHCRLMRCYSRQGQVQLALRQYHSCVAALRGELDVAPAPATTELFDRLRRREVI